MDQNGGYADHPFVAEFYDHIAFYRQRKDVGFYRDLARESGGPVLELGCGTGRILLPIARDGIPIVGLEAAEPMLAVAKARLAAEPAAVQQRVRLVPGDMRQFALGSTFQLITCPFRAFQHLLSTDDQLWCLTACLRHLGDGGRLTLDLYDPSLPLLAKPDGVEGLPEPAFKLPDGRSVVRTIRVTGRDLPNQLSDCEQDFAVTWPDGRETRLIHRFKMRYLFRFELEHLLARAGFVLEQLYADYDRAPYGQKYPRELIAIARRA